MRAQRRKITLQTARLRGELVPKAQVAEVWSRLIGNCRSRLLSLPSKLAGSLRGQTEAAVIRDRIEAEIVEALAELSDQGNFETFMADLEAVPEPDSASDDDVDASAAPDDQPVGRRKPKTKS